MSTLKVSALQDTSGKGFYPARAWLSMNGTGTIAINDSGNISSITDNGTGDYTGTYSNSMSGSGQSATFSYTSEVATYHTVGFIDGNTSTSIRVKHFNVTNSANKVDKGLVCITTTSD